jgi:hypothetical protein
MELVNTEVFPSVPELVAVTETFGTAAPVASSTVPTKSPLIAWACNGAVKGAIPVILGRSKAVSKIIRRYIMFPIVVGGHA